MMERVNKFPNTKVKNIALRYVRHNAIFAHPEMILIAMLGNDDAQVRNMAVNKVLQIRGEAISMTIDDNDFEGGDLSDQEDEDGERVESDVRVSIRKFRVPKINTNSKVYYKLVNMSSPDIFEPPLIAGLTDNEILNVRNKKLVLKYPCHTQAVERKIKVVSECSAQVVGFDRVDGLIRQKLKSWKLIKRFDAKKDYTSV